MLKAALALLPALVFLGGQIHLELSIRAKGLLLAREAGLPAAVGKDVRANLDELRYLEKAIGPTGVLAMKPIQRQSSRDLWEIQVLAEAEASGSRPPLPTS